MSRMTDQIGRVLSGRYRLIAPIGTGASAQVFLADDVRLRRRVAVKVLHAALAEDDAFLRRFRAEAQAAAALNHPNIVAVYDWGDDDGAPVHRHRVPRRRQPPGRARPGRPAHAVAGAPGRPRGHPGPRLRPPPRASCTATSSRPTCSSATTAACASPTSAWPGRWPRRRGPSRRAPCSAPLATPRPSRRRASRSTARPTCTPSASSSSSAVTGTVPFAADTTIATLMARVGKPVEVPEALGPLQQAARPGRACPTRPTGPTPASWPSPSWPVPRTCRAPSRSRSSTADADRRPHRPPPSPIRRHDARRRPSPGTRLAEPGEATVLDDAPASPPRPRRPSASTTTSSSRRDDEPPRRRWPWVLVALVLAVLVGSGRGVRVTRSSAPRATRSRTSTGMTEAEARAAVAELGFEIETRETRQRRQHAGHGARAPTRPPASSSTRATRSCCSSRSATRRRRCPPTSWARPLEEATQLLAAAGGFTPEVTEVESEEVAAGRRDRARRRTCRPSCPRATGPAHRVEGPGARARCPGLGSSGTFDEDARRPSRPCSSRPRRSRSSATTSSRARSSGSRPASRHRRAARQRGRGRRVEGPRPRRRSPTCSGMSLEEAVQAIEGAGLVVGEAFGPAKGDPFLTDPVGRHRGAPRRHRGHLPAPVGPVQCRRPLGGDSGSVGHSRSRRHHHRRRPRPRTRARPAVRRRGRQGRRERPRRRGRGGGRGDPRRRRRGDRVEPRHHRLGRRARRSIDAAVDALRAPRRARQQRRHPARPHARVDDRGGVGRRRRRPPEGPLRAHPLRRRPLARAGEGGRDGAGVDHPHVLDLGAARQPGPDQLRRRQGRHRVVQHHLRAGAGALRRAVELHRPGRPHPAHGGHARAGRRGRRPDRGLRRLGPRQRVAARRLPRHRGLRDHRPHVLRAGRHGARDGAVADGRAPRAGRRAGRSTTSASSCPRSSGSHRRAVGSAAKARNVRVYDQRSSTCPARWGGVLDVAFPSRRDEAAAPAGRARGR